MKTSGPCLGAGRRQWLELCRDTARRTAEDHGGGTPKALAGGQCGSSPGVGGPLPAMVQTAL